MSSKAKNIVAGFGPTAAAPPIPGAVHVPIIATSNTGGSKSRAKSPRVSTTTAQFNSKDQADCKCSLCVELGRKWAINHPVSECWVNPNNPRHRPALYQARLKYLKDKGLPIPALMQPK